MNEQELASLHALAQQRHAVISGSSAVQAITEAVAVAFGLPPSDIMGRARFKSISEARMVTCYVARRCTRMSFPEIGRALGLDHSTVMSAVRKVKHRRAHDRWTDSACAVLLEQFGALEGTREQ